MNIKHAIICKRCEEKGRIVPLFIGIVFTGHASFNTPILRKGTKCPRCGHTRVNFK